MGERPPDGDNEPERYADDQDDQGKERPRAREPAAGPARGDHVAHWPGPVMPRTAVALAEALTVVAWSPTTPRIWVGWVVLDGHGDDVSGDVDLPLVPGAGQVVLGRVGGLDRDRGRPHRCCGRW